MDNGRLDLLQSGQWSDLTLRVLPHGWTFQLHRAIVAVHKSFFQSAVAMRWASGTTELQVTLPDALASDGGSWHMADMQQLLVLLYTDAPVATPAPPQNLDQLLGWLRVEALARYLMCERVVRDVAQWLVGAWPDQLLAQGSVAAHAVDYARTLSTALAESSDVVAERGDLWVQLSAWARSALLSVVPRAELASIRMPVAADMTSCLALDDQPTMMACHDCSARGLDSPPETPMYIVQRRPSDGYPSALSIGRATVDYATLDQSSGYTQYSLVPATPFTSVALPPSVEPRCYTGKCPHCHQHRPLRIHWLRTRLQVN
jgi:hypothetical protein